jgi:hypothetical protein
MMMMIVVVDQSVKWEREKETILRAMVENY